MNLQSNEPTKDSSYLHGYSEEEQARLYKQNTVLASKIYQQFSPGPSGRILEIGCGSGAQMFYLLKNNPNIHITGIDRSLEQIQSAKAYLKQSNISSERYNLIQADAEKTDFSDNSFDGIYMVWVLEHCEYPLTILKECHRILKKGAYIFLTEVYNKSFSFFPEVAIIQDFWNKMIEFQKQQYGDGNIGIRLGSYLAKSHFIRIKTYAVPIFYDYSNLDSRLHQWNYWIELMESAAREMISQQALHAEDWKTIKSATENLKLKEENSFFYNFIQALAFK